VAVRLARRGLAVRLVTAVGSDDAGRLLTEALAAEGVELAALPAARSATVVALLDLAGERTMLSDRQTLDPAAAGGALSGAAWVHCSGYALLDDAAGDALAEALGGLPQDVRVSLAGGSLPPEPARADRFRRRLAPPGWTCWCWIAMRRSPWAPIHDVRIPPPPRRLSPIWRLSWR
jgi:hypothetical protein